MMGEKNENERDEPAEDDLGTTLDMVRRATLDLLDALPVRPERLRVSAADVTLHLDWRTPAVAAAGPAPLTAAYALAPAATAGAHANGSPAPLVVQEPPAPSAGDAGDAADSVDLHYVLSPSVGTFYVAPEPGAGPFAAEGATVAAGQQVAIVEAMKLMLPVEADRAGRVVAVLVDDGQPVEYGERLLALAPAGEE